MFHLTPQSRALAGIGIVVSIIALMTLCCVVFYLCLTHPETTGTRDGDAEYAKAREHWHEKQRRRKEARKASKERKRWAKLQKKANKKNPDHRHNKCACNETDTLEFPRQCSHQSPQSSREFEMVRLEEKTYVNLDCLKSPTDKDGSHLYESVHDRDGSLYEVYFTARDRTYDPSQCSSTSTDESNLSSAPSIPDRKSNVTFEIGSSTECVTMEPDYDNTSYIGPEEQTAIEPSESASSIQLFRTPINTSPSSPDSMYDVIRKHVASDLNSTFHGFPTSHENDAFSDSSSCGMYSLPH
uniref:BZIP domain-containing protein n=1 Tax=Panagrellus redivivus TaxID=6233 RepID=A0A7E4UMA0_PANRE